MIFSLEFSDEAVTIVDQNSIVTDIATDETIITVTSYNGGFKATCAVTVTEYGEAMPTFLQLNLV